MAKKGERRTIADAPPGTRRGIHIVKGDCECGRCMNAERDRWRSDPIWKR